MARQRAVIISRLVIEKNVTRRFCCVVFWLRCPLLLGRVSLSTMDVLLEDALFQSDPGSCGCFWPRALSSDSLLLPQGTATKTVERVPPKSFLEFMRGDTSSWRVVEVDVAVDDDPALTVLNNQEKLREHSSKRFGTPTAVDAEGKSKNGLSMRGNGPLEQPQEEVACSLSSMSPSVADPRSHERTMEFMSFIAAERAARDNGEQGADKTNWLLPPQSLLVPPSVQFTAEEVSALYADHRGGGREEELVAPSGAMQAFVQGQQAQLRRLLGIEDTTVAAAATNDNRKLETSASTTHVSSSSSSSSSSGLSRSHLMDEYHDSSSSRRQHAVGKTSGAMAGTGMTSAEPSSSSADSALSRLTALMADIQLDGDDDDDDDGDNAATASVAAATLPTPPALRPSATDVPPPPPLPPPPPAAAVRASVAFVTEVDEMRGLGVALAPKHASARAAAAESTAVSEFFDLN